MLTGKIPRRYLGEEAQGARGQKEEYLRRYEESKKGGETFYPFTLFKDGVTSLVIFIALLLLAIYVGVETESIANPTDTTYNPRPEWYFLFLFQMLKYFPGSLEPVAAVILPTVVILLMLLLPFYDRNPERHPLKRPLATSIGVLGVMGIVYLTYLGANSALINPPSAESPAVAEGRRLYQDLRCGYCHQIDGKGGSLGPNLGDVGVRRDEAWLARHFDDPQAVSPGSPMPRLQLLPEEVHSLTTYMKSLGSGLAFSPEAPRLFDKNCAACHTTNGKGGLPGPDLSQVGGYRNANWLEAFIKNPKALVPGATMPAFQSSLSPEQIQDIARYLASLKGGPPPASAEVKGTLQSTP